MELQMLPRASVTRMSAPCYVYELTFPNGKKYTGISIHPARRFREHIAEASRGSELAVHRAIRKYGGDSVRQTLLLKAERQYCQRIEVLLIAMCKGYNSSTGGEESPMLGLTHTKRTKKRMSDSHKGIRQSQEWVKKRTSTQIGKSRSEASRKRMSEGQKRRIRTPEELARMSAISKQRKSTPEWREKLRQAALARWKKNRSSVIDVNSKPASAGFLLGE